MSEHTIRTGKFTLGSEREEAPRGDRLVGMQKLQERNRACEHVVVVGDGAGAASLALKMRGQDVCPHCTRREAAYWRDRAKSADGTLASLTEIAAALEQCRAWFAEEATHGQGDAWKLRDLCAHALRSRKPIDPMVNGT